jgi:hypothetical protein
MRPAWSEASRLDTANAQRRETQELEDPKHDEDDESQATQHDAIVLPVGGRSSLGNGDRGGPICSDRKRPLILPE